MAKEIFLSYLGNDKDSGATVKEARKTPPSLTPDPKERLSVWIHPGTVLGDLDFSGWAHVTIMPYVPDPRYGGGAKLLRDWTVKYGKKPICKSLTIHKSGFTIVHLVIQGTLDTQDQVGKPAPNEFEPATPVPMVLKGVRAALWIGDGWEVTQGTLDDVEIDEVKIGYGLSAKGVKDIVLTENTNLDGTRKGNVKLKVWHPTKGKMDAKLGKRVTGDKIGRLFLKAKDRGFGGWGLGGMEK